MYRQIRIGLLFAFISFFATKAAYTQEEFYTSYIDKQDIEIGTAFDLEDPFEPIEPVDPLNYAVERTLMPALIYTREDRSDVEGEQWALRVTYDLLSLPSQQVLIDNAVLRISNSGNEGRFEDVHAFDLDNPNTRIIIQNVEASTDDFQTVTTDPVAIADIIPEDVRMEHRMSVVKYRYMSETEVPQTEGVYDFGNHDLEVRWKHVKGAIYYEVEWAYIDKYNLDYNYNNFNPAAAGVFANSTRIETFNQHFNVSTTYPEGHIAYRIRPIGRFIRNVNDDYSHLKYGQWSTPQSIQIQISQAFEKDFNWQFTSTFAEEGKYKKVISYFDDGLRNRQTQTNLSTEETTLVATAHYDVEGRPTVNVLPVPAMNDNQLFYKPGFNRSATDGATYNRKHFDKNMGNMCNNNLPDPLSETLNNNGLGGAAYYFSPNYGTDPDMPGIHKDYLPDAEQYPMTQVRYLNDGTGRLAYQSGVGAFYQLGNGHETRYFYDDASEMQLRRLFGSNVGDAKYYKRNVVQDANGQMSVSYIDAAGRVIATALAGNVPGNVNGLESAGTSAYTIVENLMDNNVKDEENGISKTVSTILNEQANPPTTANFTYSFDGSENLLSLPDNNGAEVNICISCTYELAINVYSPCGTIVYTHTQIIEGENLCTNATYPGAQISFSINMDKVGLYRIEKVLKVIEPDLEVVEALAGAVLPTLEDINLEPDLFDCATTCFDVCSLRHPGVPVENEIFQNCLQVCIQSGEAIMDAAVANNSCEYIRYQIYDQISPGGCLFGTEWWQNIEDHLPILLSEFGDNPITIQSNLDAQNYFSDPSLWDEDWDWNLARLHPEYCQYLLCNGFDDSRQFDFDLGLMSTWNYNGTTVDWPAFNFSNVQEVINSDPMFSSTGFYQNYQNSIHLTTTMKNAVGAAVDNVVNNNPGNTLQDVFENRLNSFGQCELNGTNQNIVNYIKICLTDAQYGGDPNLTNAEQWQHFKALYIGAKKALEEELRSAWCANGEGDCAIITDSGFFDAIDSPTENGSGTATENQIQSYTDETTFDVCLSICEARVEEWMQIITMNCPNATNLQQIRDLLTNYCFDNCNVSNPMVYILNTSWPALKAQISNMCIEDIIENNIVTTSSEVYTTTQETGSFPLPCVSALFVELNSILANSTSCNGTHTVENDYCFNGITISGNNVSVNANNYGCCQSFSLVSVGSMTNINICDYEYFGWPWVEGSNVHVNAYKMDMGVLIKEEVFISCQSFGPLECVQVDTIMDILYRPESFEDCITGLQAENDSIRWQILQEQIDGILTGILAQLNCNNYTETFNVSYDTREHHYTLYYYDQAGNLVQTIPPDGVEPLATTAFDANGNWQGTGPIHDVHQKTRYRYNTLGQVIWQYSPDGGEVNFKYDYAQRLRVSQNGRQRVQGNNLDEKISYTKYDGEGRIKEVGELHNLSPGINFNAINETQLNNFDFPTTAEGDKADVTITEYNGTGYPTQFVQENTRSRVSSTFRYKAMTSGYTDESIETRYSYDEHGNVKSLWHQLNVMDNRIQQVDYDYDLISGNVKEVAYQSGAKDEFYHRYSYDADNRLTEVYISDDSIIWDQAARYDYYLHGPLARVEIGHDKVQGSDYYYTLQGWIKGVNMPGFKGYQVDPGKDGYDGVNSLIARDAMAYGLGYYEGDYQAIGSNVNLGAIEQNNWNSFSNDLLDHASGTKGLFNGNISWMLTDIPNLDQSETTKEGLRAMVYQYDQLHRILQARAYGSTPAATNAVNWAYDAFYNTQYSYDPNGNLKTLKRNTVINGGQRLMDNLTYQYGTPTVPNRLTSVSEGLVDVIPDDPSVTNQAANNYRYDGIGNLTEDVQQGTTIEWDVYGKVKRVDFTSGQYQSVTYEYDAAGNRIVKHIEHAIPDLSYSTIYIRDASGNIMSIYTRNTQNGNLNIQQNEVTLYGSSRLGHQKFFNNERIIPAPGVPQQEPAIISFVRDRGRKYYECSNHLGNVITVITDKKTGIEPDDPLYQDGIADWYVSNVVNTSDYYPFGFAMGGGRTESSGDYRYGFNGKEKDENGEWGDQTHYDYGFRIYNPAIGKFLSVDPLTQEYPWYTPYQFAGNKPITYVDLDGGEEWYYMWNGAWHKTDAYSGPLNEQSMNKKGYYNIHQVHKINAQIAKINAMNEKSAARRRAVEGYNQFMKHKQVHANPITSFAVSAPAVLDEVAEIPMLVVYTGEGIVTGDFTNAGYQAAGVLIPGVSGTALKYVTNSGTYTIAKNVNKSLSTNGADQLTVSLQLKDGPKEVQAAMNIDADGFISGNIKKSKNAENAGVKGLTNDVLDLTVHYYGKDKVNGVKAQWVKNDELYSGYGGQSVNLTIYENALKAGKTSSEAAFETATGQWAKKQGYNNAKVTKADNGDIEVIFSKENK